MLIIIFCLAHVSMARHLRGYEYAINNSVSVLTSSRLMIECKQFVIVSWPVRSISLSHSLTLFYAIYINSAIINRLINLCITLETLSRKNIFYALTMKLCKSVNVKINFTLNLIEFNYLDAIFISAYKDFRMCCQRR